MKVSDKFNTVPVKTVCNTPVSVSFANAAVEFKLASAGVAPVADTVTALPTVAFTHTFCSVILASFGTHIPKLVQPTNCCAPS